MVTELLFIHFVPQLKKPDINSPSIRIKQWFFLLTCHVSIKFLFSPKFICLRLKNQEKTRIDPH